MKLGPIIWMTWRMPQDEIFIWNLWYKSHTGESVSAWHHCQCLWWCILWKGDELAHEPMPHICRTNYSLWWYAYSACSFCFENRNCIRNICLPSIKKARRFCATFLVTTFHTLRQCDGINWSDCSSRCIRFWSCIRILCWWCRFSFYIMSYYCFCISFLREFLYIFI